MTKLRVMSSALEALELDDVGAEVGEEAGAGGAGVDLGEVEDADAGEGERSCDASLSEDELSSCS